MFDDPTAPGGGIPWKDHKGALLLIEVLGVQTDVGTAFGVSDATSANVHVLDGPGAGEEYIDTLIFPKLLHSQTRRSVGKKVLGRLGQGEAKPSQDPPWILETATDTDKQLAEKWIKEHEQPATTAPAPPF